MSDKCLAITLPNVITDPPETMVDLNKLHILLNPYCNLPNNGYADEPSAGCKYFKLEFGTVRNEDTMFEVVGDAHLYLKINTTYYRVDSGNYTIPKNGSTGVPYIEIPSDCVGKTIIIKKGTAFNGTSTAVNLYVLLHSNTTCEFIVHNKNNVSKLQLYTETETNTTILNSYADTNQYINSSNYNFIMFKNIHELYGMNIYTNATNTFCYKNLSQYANNLRDFSTLGVAHLQFNRSNIYCTGVDVVKLISYFADTLSSFTFNNTALFKDFSFLKNMNKLANVTMAAHPDNAVLKLEYIKDSKILNSINYWCQYTNLNNALLIEGNLSDLDNGGYLKEFKINGASTGNGTYNITGDVSKLPNILHTFMCPGNFEWSGYTEPRSTVIQLEGFTLINTTIDSFLQNFDQYATLPVGNKASTAYYTITIRINGDIEDESVCREYAVNIANRHKTGSIININGINLLS